MAARISIPIFVHTSGLTVSLEHLRLWLWRVSYKSEWGVRLKGRRHTLRIGIRSRNTTTAMRRGSKMPEPRALQSFCCKVHMWNCCFTLNRSQLLCCKLLRQVACAIWQQRRSLIADPLSPSNPNTTNSRPGARSRVLQASTWSLGDGAAEDVGRYLEATSICAEFTV